MFCLLAFLLSILLTGSGSGAADIVFRDVARPLASIVRLGDIAQIETNDATERERLRLLPLMPIPSPGESLHVRAQATRELLQASGEALSAHRFQGAIVTQVYGPAAPAQPFAVEARPTEAGQWRPTPRSTTASRPATGFRPAAQASKQKTSGSPVRVSPRERRERYAAMLTAVNQVATAAGVPPTVRAESIDTTGLPDQMLLDLAGAQPTLPAADSIGPDVPVAVTFRTANAAATLPVTFREVRLVIYTLSSVPRGGLLTAANVVLLPEDASVRPAPADAFTALDQVVGLEAQRSLRADEPLSPNNCVGPLLVRRGEPVTVSSGVVGITVSVRGIARNDGRKGDFVAVEIEDRQRLDARVVGPGRLAILGAGPDERLTAGDRLGGWQ
ncbi:flagellar basal body P-ring formation chaperone FlgA [Botrimarina hoheduenensis]|uniref:Flagellar basal body P-ring biosynthesis protein FlgA n=1 Tax=Botrimarina hoheduenensis TaxID=2528000 RepID=A0A5C5VX41_9BACT|nr:flagellar basal body P-ring formation chaperone FlgA [Botrimarina hoheduenensis]TWT42687.1 flagellar basal body P-ring biosynthesis protein FlgA [Botrimarina hoheduenensis]